MGKNKKKEYVLDAVLDEETYMAYKSGQAIDNNGLRSGVHLAGEGLQGPVH